MANETSLDFACPQYVDFSTELNSSDKDDVFFDCKDHQTPQNEILCARKPIKQYPDRNIVKQYPDRKIKKTEVEGNRLIAKMTVALSTMVNTPKLKKTVVKGKHLAGAFSRDLCPDSLQPALKANTVPPAGLCRSKSTAHLNRIVSENQKVKGLRKRSSSLNDLKMHKKQIYPVTPMCLKRTIIKSKMKVVKSSEEMELEEIAKLQKQTLEHLRYNQKTLMRLKLKPRSGVTSKNLQEKPEVFKGNKGLNPCIEKLNATEKEPKERKHIRTINYATFKNAGKIENIMKGPVSAQKLTDKGLKDDKKNQPLVSTSFADEISEKNKAQSAKKIGITKKIGFHSGLIFHENVKKNTVVQPFSFDTKVKENTMSVGTEEKSEANLSSFLLKSKLGDGKENIPCDKQLHSLQKSKGIQNTKCDMFKNLAANKKIVDKYVRNPVKGFPLSENFARK